MVQQWLFVHRVLHLRDFLQVTQLKAFSLEMNAWMKHSETQSECGAEFEDQIAANFLFGTVRKGNLMECAE